MRAAASVLAGCVTTTAEDDPLQIRLDDMDRRRSAASSAWPPARAWSSDVAAHRCAAGRGAHAARPARSARERQRGAAQAAARSLRGLSSSGWTRSGRRAAAIEGGAHFGAAPSAAARWVVPWCAGRRRRRARRVGRHGSATASLRCAEGRPTTRPPSPACASSSRPIPTMISPTTRSTGSARPTTSRATTTTRRSPPSLVVLQRWPQSSKAPDAMLKLGYAVRAEAPGRGAARPCRSSAHRFPGTEAARLAQERLRLIP